MATNSQLKLHSGSIGFGLQNNGEFENKFEINTAAGLQPAADHCRQRRSRIRGSMVIGNTETLSNTTVNVVSPGGAAESMIILDSGGDIVRLRNTMRSTSNMLSNTNCGAASSTCKSAFVIQTKTATSVQEDLVSIAGTTGETQIKGSLTVDTSTLFVDSVNNRVGIGKVSGRPSTPSSASFDGTPRWTRALVVKKAMNVSASTLRTRPNSPQGDAQNLGLIVNNGTFTADDTAHLNRGRSAPTIPPFGRARRGGLGQDQQEPMLTPTPWWWTMRITASALNCQPPETLDVDGEVGSRGSRGG